MRLGGGDEHCADLGPDELDQCRADRRLLRFLLPSGGGAAAAGQVEHRPRQHRRQRCAEGIDRRGGLGGLRRQPGRPALLAEHPKLVAAVCAAVRAGGRPGQQPHFPVPHVLLLRPGFLSLLQDRRPLRPMWGRDQAAVPGWSA